ncbi:MAG: hypothetical protein CML19_02095 [Pusillimonas sp.]|nr:hypothetical protein [Pusillimonas sp.]|tara:strand:+ start:62 stop:247 length:186 start_codon:yes stop_codon:yes gene_type:complete
MSVDVSFHNVTKIEIREENKDGYTFVQVRLYDQSDRSIYFPSYVCNMFGVDEKVEVQYIKD